MNSIVCRGAFGIKRRHIVRNAAFGVVLVVAALITATDLSSVASAQQGTSTPKQADAGAAYSAAVSKFETVLRQRRAQIDSRQSLPNLPGQALYLARNDMISTYK